MKLLWTLLVITAGMGLSFEAGLLGPLGDQVGYLWATFSIFGVGSAILWLARLFSGQPRPDWGSIPSWQLIGGLLGPIYVVVLTMATPTLGVAMTMIAVLAGQIGQSVLIDSNGWFGTTKQPLNRYRLLGLVLLIFALVCGYHGGQA
ncbi:DMT family transporter [Ferrimonas senticii]|uniref:DMT family transporter n=1 Tax=Ferrimonas senticii TaxID=394566 RepID=UPI00040FABBC|nr:DMT family transporter [Ferrimonas senticii]